MSEKFPTPGGTAGGFEGGLYCPARGLSPNGDRYIHVGSLRGRALGVWVVAILSHIPEMKRSFSYTGRLLRNAGFGASQLRFLLEQQNKPASQPMKISPGFLFGAALRH